MSLGCVVLEILEGHDGFDAAWLNKCYHSSLLHDAAQFGDALANALEDLRGRRSLENPTKIRVAVSKSGSMTKELFPAFCRAQSSAMTERWMFRAWLIDAIPADWRICDFAREEVSEA